MNKKIKVSILCITYNHVNFIRDAIEGFLRQNVNFEFEIVVHDDASTDGTREVLHEYLLKYPNIFKLILQDKNLHSSGGNVLKNAIEACSGEYIAFCEGDDKWMDVNKLQSQIAYLDSNKNSVLVYSDCVPFNGNGRLAINLNGVTKDVSKFELIGAPSIYTLTTCFRNIIEIPPEAALARYGDLFMWTLLGQHGSGSYVHSSNPPMYRMHPGGMNSMKSRELKFEMLISTYAAIMMYYRRVGDSVCAKRFKEMIIKETLKYFIKGFMINLKIDWILKVIR